MKMRAKFRIFLSAISLLIAAAPAAIAHHSFASEYDSNKPVTLKGKVTKFEWTNPHARFYVDVVDEKGNVANWNLELASPNVLKRNGWSSRLLNVGDLVTVQGSAAKDGTNMANATTVILPDGKKIFAGSAGSDGAPPNQ